MGGGRGLDQVGEYGSPLQHAGLAGGADPFDPPVAFLGLGSELDLAQNDRVSEGTLRGVVRRAYPGDFAERPERVVLFQ